MEMYRGGTWLPRVCRAAHASSVRSREKTRRVGTGARELGAAYIVSAHSNPARRERARAQRLLDMAGRLSTPTDFETELQRIPSVKCALVTDLQGVVLLRAGSSTDEAALQQMAATFALTTDQANKLRLGKTKHFTLCYGALAEGERSCTHTHCLALDAPRLLCPETMTVVHVACSPLVLTLICDRRVLVIAHP